jgi:hypothetical protein
MLVQPTPQNCRYAFSQEEVDLLQLVISQPTGTRADMLLRYAHEEGGALSLAHLFANFIGLANSVESNARSFLEVTAIVDAGMHPHSAEGLNFPSIDGALNGVRVAIEPVKGMCGGCAFRLGTHANQSPCTTADALYALQSPLAFRCHAELDEDGEPTLECAGFEHCRKQRELKGDAA